MLAHESRHELVALVGVPHDSLANVVEADAFEKRRRGLLVPRLVMVQSNEGCRDLEHDTFLACAAEVPMAAYVHIPLAADFGDLEITNRDPTLLPARTHHFVLEPPRFVRISIERSFCIKTCEAWA
jgi:hypothetical protein